MKRFHVVREIVTKEVVEVIADDLNDALSLLKLQEARLLSSVESEPKIIGYWEKPTGISEPN
jgi:hypothetical protein